MTSAMSGLLQLQNISGIRARGEFWSESSLLATNPRTRILLLPRKAYTEFRSSDFHADVPTVAHGSLARRQRVSVRAREYVSYRVGCNAQIRTGMDYLLVSARRPQTRPADSTTFSVTLSNKERRTFRGRPENTL